MHTKDETKSSPRVLVSEVKDFLISYVDEYVNFLSGRIPYHSGGSNQNTISAYRNDLTQFCVYLQCHGVSEWPRVTQENVAGYLQEMREQHTYRPTTIARKLAALKSFFRTMRERGVIAHDPVENLDAPRVQKELPQILQAEEIRNLFQQVGIGTIAGKRDLAMLHMIYATGMRVTELVSLNLNDFDAEQATVICPGRHGRTARIRVLPLPSAVVTVIQQYIETARPRLALRHPEEKALFLNHHGEQLTRQGFWLIIKGYARQAGITTLTPHMLRHSFAASMLQDGMDLRGVQERLGHAHISTTQVYKQLVRTKVAAEVLK